MSSYAGFGRFCGKIDTDMQAMGEIRDSTYYTRYIVKSKLERNGDQYCINEEVIEDQVLYMSPVILYFPSFYIINVFICSTTPLSSVPNIFFELGKKTSKTTKALMGQVIIESNSTRMNCHMGGDASPNFCQT